MVMIKAFVLIPFTLLALASHVNAAQFSADYLMQICASTADGKELTKGGHAACQSYISGVLDYHQLIRSLGTAPSVDFCVPEGTSLRMIQDKIASYLLGNKHEQGAFIAAPGVALGLYKAYPCK
jgi:hypothetical protein